MISSEDDTMNMLSKTISQSSPNCSNPIGSDPTQHGLQVHRIDDPSGRSKATSGRGLEVTLDDRKRATAGLPDFENYIVILWAKKNRLQRVCNLTISGRPKILHALRSPRPSSSGISQRDWTTLSTSLWFRASNQDHNCWIH